MQVGDLVRVSNKGFTAVGYITEVTESGFYIVHYFAQFGQSTRKDTTGGLWTKEYTQLLKEIVDESR